MPSLLLSMYLISHGTLYYYYIAHYQDLLLLPGKEVLKKSFPSAPQMDKREFSVESLCKDLETLPVNMRFFSLSMRSLYAEKAVSSTSPNAVKINKLRDDIKTDALVYIEGVLPVSKELVKSIDSFFEYYNDLTFDQWLKELNDILDDVAGYIQCCTTVLQMHEGIMASLKMREDDAKVMLAELDQVTAEYLRVKKELYLIIPVQFVGALCLCLLDPRSFAEAAPSIMSSCAQTIANAAAKRSQALINSSAALVIGETIVPSIGNFLTSLRNTAGFFGVIEKELSSFKKRGQRAHLQNHYDRMKSKATEISSLCNKFCFMIPDVKSDLMALPKTPDDENYIDKWLEKTKREIKEEYNNVIPTAVENMISESHTRLQIGD